MKDEPEVEEEEEEEEDEEGAKEGDERGKTEAGSSRLQHEKHETEPEDAVQEVRPPTDFTCSKETKAHGNIFLLLPVLFSGASALIVLRFGKQNQFLVVYFDFVALYGMGYS